MKRDTDTPIDRLLIDITLDLIDEHKGLRGVTLREITKKAGCRHTNVYNYFGSFEDLLWSSLAETIRRNMEYTDHRLQEARGKESLLGAFVESQVEFAMDHPGLYHFMWLESLKGTPSASTFKVIHTPYDEFSGFISEITGTGASDTEIRQIADIIHSYMHGEICKMIKGRIFEKTEEDNSSYIVENVIKIHAVLTNDCKDQKGGKHESCDN